MSHEAAVSHRLFRNDSLVVFLSRCDRGPLVDSSRKPLGMFVVPLDDPSLHGAIECRGQFQLTDDCCEASSMNDVDQLRNGVRLVLTR